MKNTIDALVEKIVTAKEGEATQDELLVYRYGYAVMIEMSICIIASLSIGLLTRTVPELLLFSASFIPLRCFGGGYHARTASRCLLLSFVLTVVICCSVQYLSGFYAHFVVASVIVFMILVAIGFSPDVTVKSSELRERCRKITTFLYLALIIISVLIDTTGYRTYGMSVILGQMVWLISVLVSRYRQ